MPTTPTLDRPLPSSPQQAVRAWAWVLALLGAATAGSFVLEPYVSFTSQAMLYMLAVAVAAYTLRPLPSLVCAVGAVVALNFFFVEPRWTLVVDNQAQGLALLAMLVVALVISQLAARLRGETALADHSARQAQQLQALAASLAATTRAQEVLDLGLAALDAHYTGPVTLALLRADGSLDYGPRPDTTAEDGLRRCMHEAATLGPGTGRWPGLNAWYVPLGSAGQVEGALCIRNVEAGDTPGREQAQALATLLAQTLVRIRMADAMLASQAEVHRQQMQSTFLAAISHDLRTPLAALLGAASALQGQGDKLGAAERSRLLQSLVSEAQYLSRITENTLQLVQLTNAAAPLQRGWESMEEIVGAVLGRMRLRDPSHRITAQVPATLPLIEVDPVLIAQLLSNLLDNALQYSPGPIALAVQCSADATQMQVCVKDRGQAIPEAQRPDLFLPYARGDQSGRRGVGLGLAVCHAIATAHGARLTHSPRTTGGNRFCLSLPLNPQQPPGVPP